MHILVCVKQVPDTKIIKVDPKTNTLDRRGVPAILNPYDTHAVEEAVRLRARYGGKVSVLSMGPPQAVAAIKKCVEIGADEGYLISDRAFAGADTLATSYALSRAIYRIMKVEPIDLIICGKMAIDGDTGQVGPGIARRLDIPPLTGIKKVVEINKEKRRIIVHRKLEDGYEVLESFIPCLLTVEKEINEVSYSPLPNMIRAARYKPMVWTVDDLEDVDRSQLGLKGSPTIVGKMFTPPKPQGGKRLEGTADQQVEQLVNALLKEKRELFVQGGR
ncbi:electron transfer flavoprotein subunit beta/FixA family protein [Aneurinibacillus thermoaerophilus]|uniref:electron transfer flavoprotein subunit beta/FixA family protein n=1 Tax=Aneurinibacillus thermoaerophilus TaxID=143495 RepID=UPI002E2362FA|nr:electron transfer flavoprotein subunit beta/FixA family protein [Aneurinibacillus thermoaerophilus]MED0764440.1 electron transfer flavoprotein subunit beta/FixA family protein [Aneurinibacillus thermoaerophilus]